MHRSLAAFALSCLAAGPALAAPGAINVDAQPLADALNQLAAETGLVIIANAPDLSARQAPRITGAGTVEEALAILLEGSGLRYLSRTKGVWVIETDARPTTRPAPLKIKPVALPRFPPPEDSLRVFDPIVVTGSRNLPLLSESMAPIEVLPAQEIMAPASDDVIDILAQLVPSFTAQRLPLSDGNVYVRPSRLRNLAPDHTLVLINGKRRHKSALLGPEGAQAPDLAQIPASAIQRIEILKDGASAQYGADAIAGIINIITRDDTGIDAFTQHSQYQDGDGEQFRMGITWGAEMQRARLRVTSEYSHAEPTSRARQREDAVAWQQDHPEAALRNPVQRWGQPEREDIRSLMNFTYRLDDSGEVYAQGNYNQGSGLSDFNWRHPETASLYGPTEAFEGFNLADLYPNGFTPQFGQDYRDGSLLNGYRQTSDRLDFDVSAGFGRNRIDYFLFDTINASMGPESPTAFNTGGLQQTEYTVNADLRQSMAWNLPLSIAYGAEYRREIYTIRAGDPASYAIGSGAADGLTSGSNGFPGYTPLQAGDFEQESHAVYADVESHLTQRLKLGMAARYEDYSGFGEAITGKISARYALGNGAALRATVSTGFRPPTPGQIFGERTSQGVSALTLDVFTQGRFSPTGPVAAILNTRPDVSITPLRPEVSENLSAGFVFSPADKLFLSVDAYQIEIDDRFTLSDNYALTADERARLTALGVPGGESITEVSFFQNDFRTRTQGLDLMAHYSRPLSNGEIAVKASYTYNRIKVRNGSLQANPVRLRRFEEFLPTHSAQATASFDHGAWRLEGRVRLSGAWSDYADDENISLQRFGAKAFADIAVSYALTDQWRLRAGAENIFNTYPDEAGLQKSKGLIYSRNAPYDTDGGLLYVRLSWTGGKPP